VWLWWARGSSYLWTVWTKWGSTRVWHNETLVLELEWGASTKSSSNLWAYCSWESSRSSYTNAWWAYCYTTMTWWQITQWEHAHYNGCNAKTVPWLNITTTAWKFPVGTWGRGPWLVNLSYYTNENHAWDWYVRISR
jgi:hypothetical protein